MRGGDLRSGDFRGVDEGGTEGGGGGAGGAAGENGLTEPHAADDVAAEQLATSSDSHTAVSTVACPEYPWVSHAVRGLFAAARVVAVAAMPVSTSTESSTSSIHLKLHMPSNTARPAQCFSKKLSQLLCLRALVGFFRVPGESGRALTSHHVADDPEARKRRQGFQSRIDFDPELEHKIHDLF